MYRFLRKTILILAYTAFVFQILDIVLGYFMPSDLVPAYIFLVICVVFIVYDKRYFVNAAHSALIVNTNVVHGRLVYKGIGCFGEGLFNIYFGDIDEDGSLKAGLWDTLFSYPLNIIALFLIFIVFYFLYYHLARIEFKLALKAKTRWSTRGGQSVSAPNRQMVERSKTEGSAKQNRRGIRIHGKQ